MCIFSFTHRCYRRIFVYISQVFYHYYFANRPHRQGYPLLRQLRLAPHTALPTSKLHAHHSLWHWPHVQGTARHLYGVHSFCHYLPRRLHLWSCRTGNIYRSKYCNLSVYIWLNILCLNIGIIVQIFFFYIIYISTRPWFNFIA